MISPIQEGKWGGGGVNLILPWESIIDMQFSQKNVNSLFYDKIGLFFYLTKCFFSKCHFFAASSDGFHRQPGVYWIFTQTKLSSIYLLCFDETSRAACIQSKVKLANFYHHRKLRLNVVSTIRQQSKKRLKLV